MWIPGLRPVAHKTTTDWLLLPITLLFAFGFFYFIGIVGLTCAPITVS